MFSYAPFCLYELTNEIDHYSNEHIIFRLSLELMIDIIITSLNFVYMVVSKCVDPNNFLTHCMIQ